MSNAPHIPVHLGAMQETVQYQVCFFFFFFFLAVKASSLPQPLSSILFKND